MGNSNISVHVLERIGAGVLCRYKGEEEGGEEGRKEGEREGRERRKREDSIITSKHMTSMDIDTM